MKTIEEYKEAIKKALTKDELHKISFDALMNDNAPFKGVPTPKRQSTLYEKVIALCIKREDELQLN